MFEVHTAHKIEDKEIYVKYKDIYLWSNEIEKKCFDQALDLAIHPKIAKHICLMADSHMGYGMPIGGVIAVEDAIIPNAVGVDIGCGMIARKTSIIAAELSKQTLRHIIDQIYDTVPVSFKVHNTIQEWGRWEWAPNLKIIKEASKRAKFSLGTLGGGNHFIELQEGDDGYLWIMIHSGSRNLGKLICDYYNQKAIELCKKWESNIPNKDLAFLPIDTDEGKEYLIAMNFALDFAKANRDRIMSEVLYIIRQIIGIYYITPKINIHHNYASLEHHFGKNYWIHRKGATSASKGQLGIIPGSMGTSSYIVRGLGNIFSYKSCSHGAGRKMGRNDATRNLEFDQCEKDMEGIIFRRWKKIKKGKLKGKYDLGEAVGAYKDIDTVMENQKDLVEIVTKLRPLAVVKG